MSSAITAVVAGAVVSSALAGDNGAEAANNSVADANALQAQISRDQWNRYKEIYEPLERQMVDEAQDYASPENYAKAAGEASATVSQQFGKARDRLSRESGLDPSSAAYQSSLVGLDLAQAANDATQQNLARKNVTDTAYARKQSALGLGKGLDSTAASGMSNVASSNLSLANAMQRQSNAEAQAGGQLATGLVKATSNWLNGTSTTSKPAATQVDTNSYFDTGTMFA